MGLNGTVESKVWKALSFYAFQSRKHNASERFLSGVVVRPQGHRYSGFRREFMLILRTVVTVRG
jgi:hypothetical protein